MTITKMRFCHLETPLGYRFDYPVFSWVTEGADAKTQLATRVVVATDPVFSDVVSDSGKSKDINGVCYIPRLSLTPYTRYWWKVSIWTEKGIVESESSWFETGKMDAKWDAQWIGSSLSDRERHPMFRHVFRLKSKPASARLYICGLGLYVAEINGCNCCHEEMTPSFNAYDSWLQYQTFDVTPYLQEGANAIGVMLGRGWAKGPLESPGFKLQQYIKDYELIAEIRVSYADGTSEVICSGADWKCKKSPVVDSGIFSGEIWDDTLYDANWSSSADGDGWQHALQKNDIDKSLLCDRLSPPQIVTQTISPISCFKTPAGHTIIDFGQNVSGRVRVRFHAPAGTRIVLKHFECLDNGEMCTETLRLAKQEFVFLSSGAPTILAPHFSTQGFRYVCVEGWPGTPDLSDFTCEVIHTKMDRVGYIETSDPKVNQLFSNILWSQRSNFTDVPTDCPQRSERMGYTGDSQVFIQSACYNMDTDAFFHKFLFDLQKEQMRCGAVTNTVPAVNGTKGIEHTSYVSGTTGWADAACVIPWCLYQHYGDMTILARQYDSMKRHVAWYEKQDDGSHITNTYTLGDWLCINEDINATPRALLSTAYYERCARIFGKSAKVLHRNEDAKKYLKLADEIKSAFASMFITAGGRVACHTQTGVATAIACGYVPKEVMDVTAKQLYDAVACRNFRVTTGYLGVQFLCPALTEGGHTEAAYSMLLNEELPGWMYEVNAGATTMWESWNADQKPLIRSQNHFALGSVAEWMYAYMCGLKSSEDAPGFKKAVIAPKPDGRIQWAKAALDTPAGSYSVEWRIQDDGALHFLITVPFNASAHVVLPDVPTDGVTVNGTRSEAQLDVDGSWHMDVGAGTWDIYYIPSREYILHYGILSHTANELLAIPWTRRIIMKHAPALSAFSQSDYGYMKTLKELALHASVPIASITPEVIETIDRELQKLPSWRPENESL